jgi:catechol 2,3-dioxygenase-like lactoylglutathione lyase family enzyme
MRKIQTQGVIHITINGANRQTAIDFWEGVLGMPFVSSSRTSTTRRRATSTSTRATDG